MKLCRLALRGLSRNRRRTIATLLAIAVGFASISLFAGYTRNVYRGLAHQAIHAGMLGHLSLWKRGSASEGKLDPGRFLFTGEEVGKISKILNADPDVEFSAPRLSLSGLISNGRASTIFVADGISPQAAETLKGSVKLDDSRPDGILPGSGLADMLHLKNGSVVQLLTATKNGQANALDASVIGDFNTGNAGSNDKFVFMPLAFAQSLYDAEDSADRITVLLDDAGKSEIVRARLRKKLKAAGFDVEIRTWRELSDFYNQVHRMFDTIFGFIFSIVLTVVVMSVANSMGMTVIERTREIGTLRSIGLKRLGVVRLFAMEAFLLSAVGVIAGFALALLVRQGVNAAHLSYIPPGSSARVPLEVDLDPGKIAIAAIVMLAVGSAAALFPATRAAGKPIVEALGHV